MQITTCSSPFSSLSRIISCMLLAALVTFSLFVMMYLLIKPQLTERPPVVERAVVELFKNPEDSDIVVKTMPEPPPPIVQPDPIPRTTVPITNITPGTVFNMPSPEITTATRSFSAGVDKSATPVVRVEPRFPMDALRSGISGWVKLSFTIDETGGVTDVEVVQAEPRGVFEREAVRALRRWKYQPQVLDGNAVRQTNLQVVLDFTLDAG